MKIVNSPHRQAFITPFIVLFYLAAPQLGWCTAAKVEEAPVSSHYWKQTYRDSEKGNIHNTYKQKKTILTPAGISNVSQIGVTYPQTDKVRVISVIVTQPEGKRIKLNKKQMDTRLVATSSNGFTQDKKLSFLFPELKVGSTVELIFEHFHSGSSDPGKSGLLLRYLPINERIETLLEEYISDKPWILKHINTEAYDIQCSEDQKTVTITQKSPRYYHFPNELNMGYIREIPTVAMHTTEELQVSVDKEIKAWNQALKAPLPKPMEDLVKKVKDKPSEEKVVALLKYLRDNYRYLGDWRGVRRGWLPFPLAEITKRGYGDCKDLSMALVAMLRASGIEAEPALVQRGLDATPTLLPSVISPNHAIVRAKVGEKIWWLDPTNPVFLPDYIMPDIHNRWVLVFGADDRVRRDQIPREDSHLTESEIQETICYDKKGNRQADSKLTVSRFQAIQRAAGDHYQGLEAANLQLCGGDTKNCQVTRDKAEFLVPDACSMTINRYTKEAAQVISPDTLLVPYAGLDNLAFGLRHYIDTQGETDLLLSSFCTRYYRSVFKNCYLKQSEPYRIESPWLDCELKRYNSKEENECVIEFRLIRKVDWLDHKTIMSPPFKAFVEELEAMTKAFQQVMTVTYSHDLKPKQMLQS